MSNPLTHQGTRGGASTIIHGAPLPSSFGSSSTASTSRSSTRGDARPSTPLLSDIGTGKSEGLEIPSYTRSTPLRHPRRPSGEEVGENGQDGGIELYSGIESPRAGIGPRARDEETGRRGARIAEEVQEVWYVGAIFGFDGE